MKLENKYNRPALDQAPLQESRTAWFNLPVRHPALWRFVVDQILSSLMRRHRYRNLSVRMFETMVNELDQRHCP